MFILVLIPALILLALVVFIGLPLLPVVLFVLLVLGAAHLLRRRHGHDDHVLHRS